MHIAEFLFTFNDTVSKNECILTMNCDHVLQGDPLAQETAGRPGPTVADGHPLGHGDGVYEHTPGKVHRPKRGKIHFPHLTHQR